MSETNVDLSALKDEIFEYLKTHNFTVFHGQTRGGEKTPVVAWDVEEYPDFRPFLEVARQAEVKIIHTSHRTLTPGLIESLIEDMEVADLPRDEQDELRDRLDNVRPFEGFLCAVEMTFDYEGRLYLYLVRAPWFGEFLDIAQEVASALEDYDPDDDDDEDSMSPYFSKN